MADVIMTLKQIEDFFQSITAQMLELSGTDADKKVRISWPTGGAPAWKIDEDIAFIRVNTITDEIAKLRENVYSSLDNNNASLQIEYIRVLEVQWIFYGPNSFDNADKVRSLLFFEQYKELLNSNKLSMVTDSSQPTRSPELYGGRWWERSDLIIRFSEQIILSGSIPYLQSVQISTQKV